MPYIPFLGRLNVLVNLRDLWPIPMRKSYS
jgi:hypothetical protein